MFTIAGLLAHAEHGDGVPLRERQKLLGKVTGFSHVQLLAHPENTVDDKQVEAYLALCARRESGEPVEYLLGACGFWSIDLGIDARALVPRPDTEKLVEFALELGLPAAARIADLGSGSGAVALALAVEKPGWSITAVEKDVLAAALCAENIHRLQVTNVELLNFDWCNLPASAALDLVVSNPPYVEDWYADLDSGALRHEPRQALAAGPDGMDALREVIPLSTTLLKAGGWCAVEHGFEQGRAVRECFVSCGFSLIGSHRDLGGHERITVGLWPGHAPGAQTPAGPA